MIPSTAERHLSECAGKTRIGIASDHIGFELKAHLVAALGVAGCDIVDFGAYQLDPSDDYPDFVIPLSNAVAAGQVQRALAISGSGIGACIAANKIEGARAAVVTDCFSAHQGVEDEDINIMCLGALVTGSALAWELVTSFLSARFSGGEPCLRRRASIESLVAASDAAATPFVDLETRLRVRISAPPAHLPAQDIPVGA